MAVKTVTGKATGPDGLARAGATITATISQACVIPGTQEVINSPVAATSASDGTYSLSLQANNDLTPTGTFYTVTEVAVDGGYYKRTIVVPQTAGPFVITSIETAPPTLGASPSHVSTLTVDGAANFGGPVIVAGQLNGAVIAAAATGVAATDQTNLQNALTSAYATPGAPMYLSGSYLLNAPLKLYRLTDTAGSVGVSILGTIPGDDNYAGYHAGAKLTASGIFPVGEFLIDYIGSKTTTFSALAGFTIGHMTLNGASRAAGIRLANVMDSTLVDMEVLSTATPAPADTTGSPTGAISLVRVPTVDYSYNNLLDHVFVSVAGQDCFMLDQTTSSSIEGRMCSGINGGRYSYYATDNSVLIDCDAQGSTTGSYYIAGATLQGCHEATYPSKGNSIIVDNPGSNNSRMSQVIGGFYIGTNQGALSEANAAMVHFKWAELLVQFVGVTFRAGSTTSDWLYVDSGAVVRSKAIFDGCVFNPNPQPVTQKFNLNGNYNTKFVNCPGLNPLGAVTTPGFPGTTVAQTNQTGVDVVAYITAGTNAVTVQVDAVTALMVIPANGVGTVRVPAGSTFTPTYAGGTPTWKWYGE